MYPYATDKKMEFQKTKIDRLQSHGLWETETPDSKVLFLSHHLSSYFPSSCLPSLATLVTLASDSIATTAAKK